MPKKSILIIFVAVMASLLEIIDTSIVNVALPTMMGSLGATLEDISMVITGYAIANAIVLPLSGWLSERIGRRKYYLGCIVAFTAASVACGVAPNLFSLTIFRIVQGFMGGALLPTSQALIYEQFPKEKAGMAGAIFGMSVMIGPTLGPVLGGYLTDNYGWRSIFNVNLPLGMVAFFVGAAVIMDRNKTAEEDAKMAESAKHGFDSFGLGLLIAGIGCLQFLLERGEPEGWFTSKAICISALVVAVSLPLFVWWELRVPHPVINIRLFLDPIVASGVALMAGLGFFLYGLVFILPVFVNRMFHYTATQTGELFIPGSLLTAMMMPFIGRAMQGKVNPKLLIFVGLTSIEFCLMMMLGFSSQTSQTEILHMLYFRGFALAFLFVPINSSILSQYTGATVGQVAGLLNLCRQLGGSAGIALIATLLSKNIKQNYLDLSAHVSAFNPSTEMAYAKNAASAAIRFGKDLGFANGGDLAIRSIAMRVQTQAFMMSFIQLVWIIIMVFALSYIPLYFLNLKRKATRVVDAH